MKDTFDAVPEAVPRDLEVVAVVSEDFDEISGVADENLDAIELVGPVQIDQKPARRLFRGDGKQSDVEEFVCFGVNGGVQPVVVTVDPDRFSSTAMCTAVTVEVG